MADPRSGPNRVVSVVLPYVPMGQIHNLILEVVHESWPPLESFEDVESSSVSIFSGDTFDSDAAPAA